MRLGRSILLALLALSIAAFPLARGMAHALPQQAATAVADMDCCHEGEPCEKKADNCGSSAACVLKCSSLPGTLSAPIAVQPAVAQPARSAMLSAVFVSQSDNPPLPPPRLLALTDEVVPGRSERFAAATLGLSRFAA